MRYYEEAGILPAPARVGGQRRYDEQNLRRIDLLRFAQQAGFTLKEIKVLFYGVGKSATLSARWRTLATQKLSELDTLTQRIEAMRRALSIGLQCGCVRIEDCSLSPIDGSDDLQQKTTPKSCAC